MSSSLPLTSKSMWVSSSSHPLSFTCQTPELCPNFRLRSKLPESARSISDCTHGDHDFQQGMLPHIRAHIYY